MEAENKTVQNEAAQAAEGAAAGQPVQVAQAAEEAATGQPVQAAQAAESAAAGQPGQAAEQPKKEEKKHGKAELHLTPEQEMLEKLLKKQLFHARIHTALIAVFVAIVAIMSLYAYGFLEGIKTAVSEAEVTMNSVDDTLDDAQGVMEQVSAKLDELDMTKINSAIDKTDELMDVMEDTMTQTGEVIEKVSSYTETLDSVQQKVDSIDNVLNKLRIF